MKLQDNALAKQEAARETYNDYIQYLYVFRALEDSNGGNGDITCEAVSQKSLFERDGGWFFRHTSDTRHTMPLKSFLRRKP